MLPDTATNTDKLIDYHLGKINHQPTIGRVIAVQSGLMLCALVGLLYAVPASDYSADSPEERALNIAGSCYMSVLICYVGADMFFRMHLEKQWPDSELEGIVAAPLTPADFKRQNYIIGICALASGIPFSTTAITYPPEGISLGWTIAYVGYVLVAEAVLHFLPVKLTLDHPFYGTLPRWGLELWNYLRQQQKTEDEFQLIESAKDLKSRREELGKRIKNVSDHLLASFIPSLGQLDKNKLNVFLNQSSQEQFEHLLSIEQSAEQNFPTWAMNTARFLGAVTVLGSCLGYAANPFLLFTNWTGSWWKALLCVAFPLYFFGVLIAYFGDEYGKKILTDLALLSENMGTLLQGKALKLPLICRLYPISMTCFVLVNISLLIYSPAAAEQMMGLAFKPVASSTVIMMLTILAKAGAASQGEAQPRARSPR